MQELRQYKHFTDDRTKAGTRLAYRGPSRRQRTAPECWLDA